MSIRDLVNGFQQTVGNIGSAIGQGVQSVEHAFTPQPPIQQPIPQAQSMVPQQPPQQDFMSWLGNTAKAVGGAVGQQAQNVLQGKNVFGQQQPFSINNPMAPAPQVDFTSWIKTGNPVTDVAAKLIPGMAESVLNAPHQIQQIPGKIGQIAGGDYSNPQKLAADVADIAMPIATVATLPFGGEAAMQLGKEGILQGLKEGAITGAKYGAGFGALSGLSSGRDITDPVQYLQNLASNTAMGVGTGIGAGGLLGGVSGAVRKLSPAYRDMVSGATADQFHQDIQENDPNVVNHVAIAPFKKVFSLVDDPESQNFIADAADKVTSPSHMGDTEPNHIIQQATNEFLPSAFQKLNTLDQSRTWLYLVDRLNGRTPQDVPTWMSKFDNAIFDTSGTKALQAGRINFGAKIGGEEKTPLQEAQYRFAKSPDTKMEGNPEPLPWETPGGKRVNEALQGTPYKFDESMGTTVPRNPKEAQQPFVTNPNGKLKDALRAYDAARSSIIQRGKIAAQFAESGIDKGVSRQPTETETNYGENKLFRQALEHPENLEDIVKSVKNPEKFLKAVQSYQDLTDYVYQQSKQAGSKLGFLENYYSHILDLSKPGEEERLQQFINAKAANYKGWYNKMRVFSDIEELEQHGFRLKNKNVVNDIAHYANSASLEQGARVLTNELKRLYPDKVITTDVGQAPPANAEQLTIPGMKGVYVTPDLHAQLKHLESVDFGTAAKVIDGFNSGLKHIDLSGSGFHIINTGEDYLGTHLSYLKLPRVNKMVEVFFSPQKDAEYRQQMINEGVMDAANKMNITLSSRNDFTSKQAEVTPLEGVRGAVSKVNPFEMLNRATFQRLEDFFKLETVRILKEKGDIDLSTPEGIKNAQSIGAQLNNVFGGQNRVIGDSIFKSKFGQWLSRIGFLAPDYQEGRFKRTFSAFKIINRDAGNNFALRSLVGRLLITGLMAEVGKKLVTGKFSQNIVDAVKNDIFDPAFPSPFDNNKKKQLVHLPASNLSDITRIVADPTQIPQNAEHFLISHLGAGASNAMRFASNQDYYGNKLSQTNDPLEKAFALAQTNMPIPFVQGLKVAQGKENPGNALINIIGLRVSTDPNDPTMKFFQARDKAIQASPKEVQDAFTALANVKKMDPNDPNKRILEGQLYSTYPQLFGIDKIGAFASANGDESKMDPIYNSKYASIVPYYFRYEALPPKDAFAKQLMQDHPEIGQLMQDRQAFFQANPIQPRQGAIPFNPGPQPTAYVQQQLNAKNFSDPQVQQYFNDRTAYDNQKLQQLKLSPVNSYGQLPFQVASSNASFARSRMRKNLRYASKKINQEMNKRIVIASGHKPKGVKIKPPKLAASPTVNPYKIALKQPKNPLKTFKIV